MHIILDIDPPIYYNTAMEIITEKTHPEIWKIISKFFPDYPYQEARIWERGWMGLVARYPDSGWMCTYYIIQNDMIKRFPDKPCDDSPTEFVDLPKGALGISTGVNPIGISIIDIFSDSENP